MQQSCHYKILLYKFCRKLFHTFKEKSRKIFTWKLNPWHNTCNSLYSKENKIKIKKIKIILDMPENLCDKELTLTNNRG